jgi:hypothetical protein
MENLKDGFIDLVKTERKIEAKNLDVIKDISENILIKDE